MSKDCLDFPDIVIMVYDDNLENVKAFVFELIGPFAFAYSISGITICHLV